MVEHDSTIPPGRVGKVTQQVDLHGISGAFKKSIMVVSNAANEPRLSLVLKGIVRAQIEASPRYVQLSSPVGRTALAAVTLKSAKGDLKVKNVMFRLSGSGLTDQWQASAPLPVGHALQRTAGKDANGYVTYELTLSAEIASAKAYRGTFEIATNHAQKPLVEIQGAILAQ